MGWSIVVLEGPCGLQCLCTVWVQNKYADVYFCLLLLSVPRGMSQFQEAYVMFHFTPSQVQLISNSG